MKGQKTVIQKKVKISKDKLLSFKPTGRVIELHEVQNEFKLMSEACGRTLTPDIMKRVCEKSGTHLVKLTSPRASGDHAILRIAPSARNMLPALLPSVNATDIPCAKIIFRPLEILGQPPKSLVDHVRNPEKNSAKVCSAFESVFGSDVLMVLKSSLQAPAPEIKQLSAGEFPIIFIPSPMGSDLQVTPVAPASSYMDMKKITEAYFKKQEPNAIRVSRGSWHKQAVSAKPQNISGAIGGPRVRFLARMPKPLLQFDAEIYRFVHGGQFPNWRDPEVIVWVHRYADLLERDRDFNNQNTRAGLDRLLDRLLHDVRAFIMEVMDEAYRVARFHNIPEESLNDPPSPAIILLRRFWPKNGFDQARKALNSSHFDSRERMNHENKRT